MDTIVSSFVRLFEDKGITLSKLQLDQFELYYQELVSWNEKINLTAITEREQVYVKHFYDSASLSFFFPLGEMNSLADIGAGAGFPSIPLKIVFPHLKVTIIDSLQKRIAFLKELIDKLGLADVRPLHSRAEDAARLPDLRDTFDIVTARAVARLSVLNEFCLPFTKIGGYFVAMKGSDPAEEMKEANRSFKELNGKLAAVHHFQLPIEQSDRHIIVINKVDKTPKKYPRKAGVPLKSPLI